MKKLGVFWNDSNIEVYEIEGKAIALDCWNGEVFTNCFEVSERINGKYYNIVNLKTRYKVKPVYKINFNELDEFFKLVDYEFC